MNGDASILKWPLGTQLIGAIDQSATCDVTYYILRHAVSECIPAVSCKLYVANNYLSVHRTGNAHVRSRNNKQSAKPFSPVY
jgi:hypothetical protein